jgi:hypothetical protein
MNHEIHETGGVSEDVQLSVLVYQRTVEKTMISKVQLILLSIKAEMFEKRQKIYIAVVV